jgi:hypothetical protein
VRRKTWLLFAAVVLSAAGATGGVVAMSGGKQATAGAQEPLVGSPPAYSKPGAGDTTTAIKRSTKELSEALNFAQCMRENGVKDFPDPVKGERLVDATRLRSQIPSSGTPGGMSILHAAMQKCAVTSWERQWGG